MTSSPNSMRVLVSFQATEVELDARFASLRSVGMILDESYGKGRGAVCTDPTLEKWVSRGQVDKKGLARLNALDGFHVFTDPGVRPVRVR